MDDDIPLVIPEVNAEHLDLLEVQRDERGWDGAMVKNPNCSTITFVPTLAALTEFGLEKVHVSTLQAVSGAGYDGVSSMEIIDNAIPYIGGEGGQTRDGVPKAARRLRRRVAQPQRHGGLGVV